MECAKNEQQSDNLLDLCKYNNDRYDSLTSNQICNCKQIKTQSSPPLCHRSLLIADAGTLYGILKNIPASSETEWN